MKYVNRAANALKNGEAKTFLGAMSLLEMQSQYALHYCSHFYDRELDELRKELIDWCLTARFAVEIWKSQEEALERFRDIANGLYQETYHLLNSRSNFLLLIECYQKNNYTKLALPEEELLCIFNEKTLSR